MKKEMVMYNGVKIPVYGYGTWLVEQEVAAERVKLALDVGYRHIDSAQAYGNEVGVGEGFRASGLKREEVFITTKVRAELKNYEQAKASMEESLKKLGLDYVDLILIHCPQPWAEFRSEKRYFKENIEVWKALEEFYKAGKARSIGVSNFGVDDMQNILEYCEIKPMVNQMWCHIGNTPSDVIKFCQQNDIIIEAYSPIAHGRALQDERIIKMAEKYHVSPAQLCIQYTLQLDTVTLPKASSREHMKDNIDIDFEISKEDMIKLLDMNENDYGDAKYWPIIK